MPEVKIIADLRESEQSRIAVLEDGKLAEIFIEYDEEEHAAKLSRQGDIFKARVDKIMPSINAAFVAISSKHDKNELRNAFLYLGESIHTSGLKAGQNIIVQIIKNARKNKAPRVSARISLPGRWLVLVPDSDETGVSRRIEDNSERKRLKKFAETLQTELVNFGVIIRTAAENIPEELLRSDINSLLELWNEIKRKSDNSPAPCMLYRDTGALGRVLRDEICGSIDEIIIDDPDEFSQAEEFAKRFFPEMPDVKLYSGTSPIFEYFGIEQEIQKALERKVWLRSGAYLVIDQTEALTVIDVNTGKFTSAPDMRHTVLATNLEAADEIARQLRLRSTGGIIIVDFIGMLFEEDRHELIAHFEKKLSHDRQKSHIFGITHLGLVELTRRRERPDLKSILTRNCPVCIDNGFVEREENIAMNIKRFIRKITGNNNSEAFMIQCAPYAASYISHVLSEWENEFQRKIIIASMPDFNWSKYKLYYQGDIESTESQIKELRQKYKGQVIIFRT